MTFPMATVGNDQVVKPAWLPEGLYQEWLQSFIEAGGSGVQGAAEYATEFVRNSPSYDQYFPGIRRDDGSLRYGTNPEATYFNNVAAFRNTVEGLQLNLNPDVFEEEYIALIQGDVSPNEFGQRVTALESRVLSQGPAIRDFYAENYGLDMTSQGILAGLMSERVDTAILTRQITMAEIAGEGISRGFDVGAEFANMLATQGTMDRDEAQRMFGTAEKMLPLLGGLAARHGDPNDTFDIYDFADAVALDDPTQTARIERLKSQESATFTGGKQLEIAASRETGGLTGLTDV